MPFTQIFFKNFHFPDRTCHSPPAPASHFNFMHRRWISGMSQACRFPTFCTGTGLQACRRHVDFQLSAQARDFRHVAGMSTSNFLHRRWISGMPQACRLPTLCTGASLQACRRHVDLQLSAQAQDFRHVASMSTYQEKPEKYPSHDRPKIAQVMKDS